MFLNERDGLKWVNECTGCLKIGDTTSKVIPYEGASQSYHTNEVTLFFFSFFIS